MSLMEMSIAGGVLIAFAALLRALTLNRLPKRGFVALWCVALARLLLPYSLKSPLSVYSLAARLRAAGATASEALPRAVQAVTASPIPGNMGTPVTAPTPGPAFPLDIRTAVWLAGALACGLYFALAYIKCRREFRASLPADSVCLRRWLSRHKLHRRLKIRQSDRIRTPLTYGLARPVILLPRGFERESEQALDYMLTHEYVHIRRFDAALKLALTAAVCLHWFNPLVWLMYVLANRDIELSCDEAVLRRLGRDARADYAMVLVRMEEQKNAFTPLCSGFSKSAAEERIIAIMKMKKKSLWAAVLSACLVLGMSAAFATSAAEPDKNIKENEPGATVTEAMGTVLSYTDPTDGKTYYRVDTGDGFEALTEEEFEKRWPTADVEWWTAEEYAAWLENEKKELQSMLGEKGWTGGRGDFIWTQEMIDETIAMYEGILEQIKDGYLVSKTVDGSEDTMLMMNVDDMLLNGVYTGNEVPPIGEYEPFGVTLDEKENALYYKGKKIRYFQDSVEVSEGGISSRCNYYRADGIVSLRTVRGAKQNPDGSTDPFGDIIRLEKLSDTEADELIVNNIIRLEEAYISAEALSDELDGVLDKYAAFGLSYEIDPDIGYIMSWQGKTVHSLFDTQTGTWYANSQNGYYLGTDAVDLETVYKNGELAGLKVARTHASGEHEPVTAVALGTGDDTEEGTPLPGMFDKYAPFGLEYRETEAPEGLQRNLFYKGKPVNKLSDTAPDGGVFTFSSSQQSENGLTLRAVYTGGELTGVEPLGAD